MILAVRVHPESPEDASAEAAIAGEFAKLLAASSGHGPEQITCYVEPDYVLVIMSGVMSTAERTLARAANSGLAGNARLTFHETMRPRLRELVEKHTGRQVRCALPQFDQGQDILVEVLLLEASAGP